MFKISSKLPGVLNYKCLRCGKITKGETVTDVTNTMNAYVLNDTKYFKKNKIQMPLDKDNHFCDDGHIGITKLIGCEVLYKNEYKNARLD